MKAVMAIAKRMLASNYISYIITAAVVLCATSSGNVVLSRGNYTWLLVLMSPFFFVFYDYKKLMYLGCDKKDYYLSAIVCYAFLALVTSLANTVIHSCFDTLSDRTVINMIDVCRWSENGIIVSWLQQLCFLFMVMSFLHLLLSMQERWYGWLTDAVLAAVICVFTPVAPLRRLLASFFSLVMLNGNAPVHIAVCIMLSALFSAVSLIVLKHKTL